MLPGKGDNENGEAVTCILCEPAGDDRYDMHVPQVSPGSDILLVVRTNGAPRRFWYHHVERLQETAARVRLLVT